MRARSLKPGYFGNEELAEIEPLGRILYAGLWCYADREGRFEFRPKRMKAMILPYDDVDITSLVMSLHAMTLISLYKVDEKIYGFIPTFKRHQNPHPHEAKSVIPEPLPELMITREELLLYSGNGLKNQCQGKSVKCNASSLTPSSLTPSSPVPGGTSCVEPSPTFILIPTNKKGVDFPVTEEHVREFEELYLAVDVPGQLRKMRGWSNTHKSQRKTYGGMLKFINGWLAREQDKGGSGRDLSNTVHTKQGQHNARVLEAYIERMGPTCKTD